MADKTRKRTEGYGSSDGLAIGNTFINDGSFLEMFKKRMEEEKNRKGNPNTSTISAPTKASEIPVKTESKNEQPAATDKPESDASTASGNKPIIQGFVGKRKALMKSSELREKRKKRREQLLEEQEETDKSDAWKAYMAEVKEYQAKSCSEEVHNRPLVK